ncbi:MAG: hypothetical protein R3192_10950 [Woeseiaceae bacterium]|nr:hypothetical protein [Woeseiaceae bacterium]
MKLRILDNSIRLRLTRSEVESVQKDGLVKGRLPLADGVNFDYVLESSPATIKTAAHLSNNVLTVRVPESEIVDWTSSEQVAISASQDLSEGVELRILVEKDFACLAPREGEDESDMFPHPLAGKENC